MTASDLSGRDLDMACALALGWTFVTFPDGPCPDVRHWKRGDGIDYLRLIDPPFSTDPATLGEMKVWIRSMGHVVQAVHWLDGSVTLKLLPDDVTGGTDNEAWARLVVAVKEAMGDG